MVYPLISEYTEAILSAEDNFNELSYLRPVLDDNGNPIMSSGNFAVVYKMRDINTGKYHAVKCFTRDQENRNKRYKNICSTLSEEESIYLTTFSFHEAELFVDSSQTDETEFPVLLMDWVDGKPLDKFIEEYSGNPFVLYELCYNFRQMAKWLVSKSFAHGDLKPDNILVQEDANIVLIDYDGMYVWSRERQEAPEGGTPEYRNPFHQTYYNGQMDDFALAVLALSLNLISISYDVQNKYNRGNGLLFSVEDIKDINNSEIFIFLRELLISEPLLGQYYATFIKSLSGNTLIESDFDFKNERKIDNLLLFNPIIGKTADNGIIYSSDGRFVIGYDKSVPYEENIDDNYIYIKEGTIGIVENAFDYDTPKLQLFFPSTLRYFSSKSLNYRYKRINWNSPWYSYKDGYILTKDLSEAILKHLVDANFPIQTKIIGMGLYENLKFEGVWPHNIKRIRSKAFAYCKTLPFLIIPNSIIDIGDYAFMGISSSEIILSENLKELGLAVFSECKNLERISFRGNFVLKRIKERSFFNNTNLKEIIFPTALKIIEKESFKYCTNIRTLKFPDSLEVIEEDAFAQKVSKFHRYNEELNGYEEIIEIEPSELKSLYFPLALSTIGKRAFQGNVSLNNIIFSSNIALIGKDAFKYCKCLNNISYITIKTIENGAFYECPINFILTDKIEEIKPGAITGSKITENISNNFIIEDNALYSKDYENLIYYWGEDETFYPHNGVKEILEEAILHKPFAIKVPDSCRSIPNYVKCVILPQFMTCEYDIEWDILFTHEDIFVDEFGVIYSNDKKKLLSFSHNIKLEWYNIIEGCEEISNNAFREELSVDEDGAYIYGNHLSNLIFPKSLKTIGDYSLKGCHQLTEIKLPKNIEYIGDNPFPNSLIEIDCSDTKFSFIEGCLLKNNYQIVWISPHTKAFHLPPTVKYKGMICESYKNCLVTNNNNLIYVLNNIDFFIAPKRVSKVCNQSFPYEWPISKKLNLIYFQNGLKEIEEETWEWGRAPDDLYLPWSVNKIGNIVNSPKYHREYFYDHMFSKRIHIPFGSLSHFLEILPGIDPIKLIEDYDEFDPESI